MQQIAIYGHDFRQNPYVVMSSMVTSMVPVVGAGCNQHCESGSQQDGGEYLLISKH